MANLVSVQEVSTRLGMGSTDNFVAPDKLDQIYSAITGATIQLEGYLRTTFARATSSSVYHVDPEEKPYTDQYPKLYLSAGFLDATVSPDVMLGEDHATLSSATPLVDTAYYVDNEKGLILITTETASTGVVSSCAFFAKVTYTHGFTAKASEFGSVYEGVPDWLREAAIQLAIRLYHQNKPCDDKDAACPVPIGMLIEGHIRFYPTAIAPLI